MRSAPLLFITGTDTGVGKTLLTALLLRHARQSMVNCRAIKPFCSGGREDLRLIAALQDTGGDEAAVAEYYFDEPLAPWVAARRKRRAIDPRRVLRRVGRGQQECELLLVEGVGGLCVPLTRSFWVADLIECLRCPVIVVGQNRLGILNHAALTVRELKARGLRRVLFVLMERSGQGLAERTNREVLGDLLRPTPVISIPYLGPRASSVGAIKRNEKKIKKTLARILGFATFSPLSGEALKGLSERQKIVDI